MAYNIVVKVGVDGTEKIDQTTGKLEDATQAAVKTTDALTKTGAAGKQAAEGLGSAGDAAKGTAGDFSGLVAQYERQQAMLARIKGPWNEYQADLKAAIVLLRDNKLSANEYEAEMGRLQTRLASIDRYGMSPELKREADLLDRIQGPLREYEQTLKALDSLLQKEQIDLADYNRELEKAQKAAGRGLGPVQGPQQQGGGPEPAQPGDLTGGASSALGTASSLLAGGAIGSAVVGLGMSVQHLIDQFHELQDTWTEATNTALKFTDASHTANLIIDEQIRLAHELHSNERATIELYDTVRDGTDDLNISHRDQIRLTKSLAEEVQLAGRSLEAAGGIITRFSYALARGKIEVGDLNRIMRQVPELGDLWTKTFDTDRQGLLAMVREGKIGVEQIVQSLVDEGKAIDANFERRQRTHKQLEEEWVLNEKLYSQRYDVSYGAGHATKGAIDALKKNPELMESYQGFSGQAGDLAKIAQKEYLDEQRAAIEELIKDVKNLTGPLQSVGDAYRKMTGDTAAVRAEVTKLTEPFEQARSELETLNKAFEVGKIDVDTYNKRWVELQTTLGKGIGPQTFKITDAIRVAKAELDRFLNEIEQGANVTQAQARKYIAEKQTAIHGALPEDLKLNNPVAEAKEALADLNRAQKAGQVTSEAYRREYDALMTTINDGRLPEAIKIWESIHDPIDQAARDFRALNALLKSGRLDVDEYTVELKKIAETHKSGEAQILADGIAAIDQRMKAGERTLHAYNEAVRKLTADFATLHKTSSGIVYRIAPEGPGPAAPDFRAQIAAAQAQTGSATLVPGVGDSFQKLGADLEEARKLANEFVAPAVKYEDALEKIDLASRTWGLTEEQATALRRRAKETLNQETEALEAQKGPMEAYQAALKKLKDQLEAGDISAKKYADGIDSARVAMLQATGAADDFQGAMEIEWIKMQQEADKFGATVASLAVNDFGKLNEAIVTAANGGAVSWGQMADSMIQDLERIALKMLEVKLVSAGIGLFSSGGGGMDAGLVDEFAKGMGFASGGSFIVGGQGGTDSKYLSMRVTPGEMVTVRTPGQQTQAAQMQRYAPQQAPVVHVHNHYDSAISEAAIDSPGGSKRVMNVLRASPGAVRNLTSQRRRV